MSSVEGCLSLLMSSTRWIGLVSVVALAAMLTDVFQMTDGMLSVSRAAGYSRARTQLAFGGMAVDELRVSLLSRNPPVSEVSLSPELSSDVFKQQRLTEGLYPVRVTERARVRIVGLPNNGLTVESDGSIVDLEPRAKISTNGAGHWNSIVFHLAALLVAGVGVAWVLMGWTRAACPPQLASWLLGGTFVVASSIVVGSIFQNAGPLRWSLVSAVCLGCLSVFIQIRAGEWPRLHWPGPSTWLALLLAATVAAVTLAIPIAQWDGRSVWFFRAHEIAAYGFLSLRDATNPEWVWTHHDYPPLLPGLAAFFGSNARGYSERAASVAIPVLVTGCLFQISRLMRRAASEEAACWAMLLLFGANWRWWIGGYGDSHVAMLLTIEVLALSVPEGWTLGWLAAGSAALVKPEGLILSILVALLVLVRASRAERRRAVPWLLSFAPALAWSGWAWAHSLGTGFQVPSPDSIAHFPSRFAVLVSEMGWAMVNCPLFPISAAGLIARALFSGRPSRLAVTFFIAALLATAFACAGILLNSIVDIRAEIRTALDRLLLHAAAFECAAVFTWTSIPDPQMGRAMTERRLVEPSQPAPSRAEPNAVQAKEVVRAARRVSPDSAFG